MRTQDNKINPPQIKNVLEEINELGNPEDKLYFPW
jgi:hypothetical protein